MEAEDFDDYTERFQPETLGYWDSLFERRMTKRKSSRRVMTSPKKRGEGDEESNQPKMRTNSSKGSSPYRKHEHAKDGEDF